MTRLYIYKTMFEFCNNFFALNSSIYRDLQLINLANKKESLKKEMKELKNIKNVWNIRAVSSKACQTETVKYCDKGCQTEPYVPQTLSEAIQNYMLTNTYVRDIYHTSNDSSDNSDNSDTYSVDTVEAHEFIMLDS